MNSKSHPVFFNRAALAGYFGLVLLLLAWNTLLRSTHHHTVIGSLIIALVPLLLPLRGLLQGSIGAFIAAAMLSLLYFMHGVAVAFEPGESLPAALEIAFSLILFGGAIAYVHSAKAR
jgi:uncharacterized membrane protein